MSRKHIENIFKPASSRLESKSDATNRAAREIIERDAAATAAKTERLRAARLAHEAAAEPISAKEKATKL